MHETYGYTNQCMPHTFPHMQKQRATITERPHSAELALSDPLPAALNGKAHLLCLRTQATGQYQCSQRLKEAG